MTRRLIIWWDGVRVGQLGRNAHGGLEFSYAPEWLARQGARPLSASLPLQPKPFRQAATLPFFEGLLPEASQRTAISKILGTSERNIFGLLKEIGGEVAGAIEIWPEDVEPAATSEGREQQALSDEELVALIKQLPERPMLVGGKEGLRLSLAGAQSKLPMIYQDGKISLPASGQPTTHILKPEIERFAGTAENEAICMRLAQAVGLKVPAVEYRSIGGKHFLLIERYDRIKRRDGKIIRLHQEDFCQALGLTSDYKYSCDDGPILRDCFALIRRVTSKRAADALRLLDATLFNAVIGNADAHAKNFSLLYSPARTHLAPLYDLISTVAYPGLSQRFAMKIGGRHTLEEIRPGDLEKIARDSGFRAPFILKRLVNLAKAIEQQSYSVVSSLNLPTDRQIVAQPIADNIIKRAQWVLAFFKS